MFVCDRCHRNTQECGIEESHFSFSHGACEFCKVVGMCADCHCNPKFRKIVVDAGFSDVIHRLWSLNKTKVAVPFCGSSLGHVGTLECLGVDPSNGVVFNARLRDFTEIRMKDVHDIPVVEVP